MSKTIRNLAVLFAAQVVLIVLVWSLSSGTGNEEPKPFLPGNIIQATKVTIQSEDGTVVLEKSENGWLLPEYGSLAVAENKLEDAMAKLAENTVRWPAATSESAAKRFEVSKDNAQKTVTFYKGDAEMAVVRLGTSPGYRKVHAREGDSKQIYALNFAQFDMPGKSEDWFDKSLFKFKGEIGSVKTEAFQLAKSDDNWVVSSLPVETRADQDAVQEWIDRFTRLQVSARVDENRAEAITVQNPALNVELTDADSGNTRNYVFYKNGDKFFIKEFGKNNVFEIAEYSAKPIVAVDPASFAAEEAEEEAAPEAEQTTEE